MHTYMYTSKLAGRLLCDSFFPKIFKKYKGHNKPFFHPQQHLLSCCKHVPNFSLQKPQRLYPQLIFYKLGESHE